MLTHNMQSYLLSVTYYMQLITDHTQFDYAKMLTQLAAAVKRDDKVPLFVPYLEKAKSNR